MEVWTLQGVQLKRSLITELILAAKQEYSKFTVSRVTIHLSTPVRCLSFFIVQSPWKSHLGLFHYHSTAGRTILPKSRRSLKSLILPPGVKEMLLEDIQKFLTSEDWYKWGGVPHKRGLLLLAVVKE